MWLKENEETKGRVFVTRPGKLMQLQRQCTDECAVSARSVEELASASMDGRVERARSVEAAQTMQGVRRCQHMSARSPQQLRGVVTSAHS